MRVKTAPCEMCGHATYVPASVAAIGAVSRYLEERDVQDDDGRELVADVIADYRAWADQVEPTDPWTTVAPTLSPQTLGKAFITNGLEPYRSNGKRYYRGITLKPRSLVNETRPISSLFDLAQA